MAGETTITTVGNLTSDPELRFTPQGVAMVKFTVASTPRTFDRTKNEWADGDPLFLACTAWRDLAEHVAESLAKGTRVVVTGRLRLSRWRNCPRCVSSVATTTFASRFSATSPVEIPTSQPRTRHSDNLSLASSRVGTVNTA